MNALRRADITLSEEDHYMTMLVQTEVERIKFLVRSYVRTRLFKVSKASNFVIHSNDLSISMRKIEQYAAYITREKDIQERLTEAELRHAQR